MKSDESPLSESLFLAFDRGQPLTSYSGWSTDSRVRSLRWRIRLMLSDRLGRNYISDIQALLRKGIDYLPRNGYNDLSY